MTSNEDFTINIGDLIIDINPDDEYVYGLITNIDKYLDIEVFWFDIKDFFYYNVNDIKSCVINGEPRKWEIIRSKKTND